MQTNEVMTNIKLSGSLAKTFGRVHQRLISTPREVFRALSVTVPGFEKYLNTSKARGLTYAVMVGKRNISENDLDFPNAGQEIRIVPVIIGSKRAGVLQTILGAVLVVASIWMPGVGIAASNMMFAAGAAMTMGGVAQMLSPQPGGISSKQDADNKASYAFGSVTNTVAQGNPVPLGYGKRRIGGAIISAGIFIEDKL
ncbi:MAG: tail assembly protein [Kluyvera cryocrescens]|nr:tail assembly protein [Kluyvera cryocrescens]